MVCGFLFLEDKLWRRVGSEVQVFATPQEIGERFGLWVAPKSKGTDGKSEAGASKRKIDDVDDSGSSGTPFAISFH